MRMRKSVRMQEIWKKQERILEKGRWYQCKKHGHREIRAEDRSATQNQTSGLHKALLLSVSKL